MHPLVLLSVVDHYNRVAKDTRKRSVGILLGERRKVCAGLGAKPACLSLMKSRRVLLTCLRARVQYYDGRVACWR